MQLKLNMCTAVNEAVASKQFVSIIFVMLIVLSVSDTRVDGRTIEPANSYKDILIPDIMVQCRASCIDRFLLKKDNEVELLNCGEHSNCAMCWDFCETLFVERQLFKNICSNYFCVSFTNGISIGSNLRTILPKEMQLIYSIFYFLFFIFSL